MPSPLPPLAAPWRIGVDVGGTFTDMVLRDDGGAVRIFKAPSVPADPSEGVLGVLRLAAQQLELPLSALLRDCALFVHGSTVATNTILEKKGAKVGMLTTEGFRDSLEIRRGFRENQWDHRAPFPQVLAPRYLRLPVRGRIGADGKELAPLSAEDVDTAAKLFAAEGVESVAVCLFNSFLDGAHERRVGAQLAKSPVGKWVSLSSEVMPTMGEYERGSTAVVNAYIAPKVTSYLHALDEQLRQLGLPRSVLLLQSNGGAVSVDQIAARPVMLVLSGPAAGVGALKGCAAPGEPANLISMEIGGTSCDVMVMAKGDVPVTDELIIDGYHLTTPSVEIHTVGAGGGTVAWVDDAGLLHVGPQGAGARPGPAAYGLGGENPTVTDAQLVLGRLRPGALAGGAVTLDGKLAREAIEKKLAKPLGLSVEDAAAGVIRLLEQNLLHAVERLSIERGHNPATFTLVAAGGAGPMHGTSVARALGCRRTLLPRAAGAFCAMGMLQSDVRQDYLQVFLADLDKLDLGTLESGFMQIEARARDALQRDGFSNGAAAIEREIDLRYDGQQWPVRVSIGAPGTKGGFNAAAARQAFETEHQRLFGHIQPGGRIDITALRVVGRGRLDWTPPAARSPQETAPKPRETRKVWIDPAHGWRDVPIYDGADLRPGCKLAGPLLIEERTMTAFVGPRDLLEVDERDDFLVHVGAAS
jgi:N-methylhydantoinase A